MTKLDRNITLMCAMRYALGRKDFIKKINKDIIMFQKFLILKDNYKNSYNYRLITMRKYQ